MSKLTSRKFWLAVGGSAAGVASIVSGIAIPDETATVALTIVGAILTSVSVVAYNFAEAYVDGKSVESDQKYTEITTNLTTDTLSKASADKLVATVSEVE